MTRRERAPVPKRPAARQAKALASHGEIDRPEPLRVFDIGSLARVPGPEGREVVRKVVEEGLPVGLVRQLQDELARLGVPRPSKYVELIASRAARSRREILTPQEGERLVRIASTLARTLEVWENNEEAAAEFLSAPHPELEGDTPIDRARSEIGARQVEDILLRLDLGLPV
jgi:putative toxin-antitoxin system antitoxin component (TIGR02293 family)